jgi:hypothetical protein
MAATTSITVATYGLLAVLVTGSWIAALSLVAWIVVAAAVGVAVRNQRRALVAAHLRAQQAESTREEEAQRRVAEERLRIAQELHDVIAHHVSVINVQSGVARHLLQRDPRPGRGGAGGRTGGQPGGPGGDRPAGRAAAQRRGGPADGAGARAWTAWTSSSRPPGGPASRCSCSASGNPWSSLRPPTWSPTAWCRRR